MAKTVRQAPKENEIYRHFKGSLYRIITIAVHTETSDKLVVYQSVEKPERVFARPLDMFMSEVDRLRYPFVKAKYRFTLESEEASKEDTEMEIPEEKNTSSDEIKEEPECSQNDEKDTNISKVEEPDVKDSTPVLDEMTDDNAIYKADGELVIDPIVEAVLDEKEFSKKIENFERLRNKCTEEMLTTIAISLDIQLEDGTIEEQYAQILKTLRMHDKYESARLRG